MLSYILEIGSGSSSSYFNYGSYPAIVPDLISIIVITGIANVVLNVLLLYLLVNRRGTHFKRQKFLYEDITSVTNSLAKTKNVESEAGLSSIERTVREADTEETSKDAVLFAILAVFIPFFVFYVYYFLMKDFYKHEQRENWFWRDLSMTLNKLDINFSVPRRTEDMPDRSFALYFVLTLITAGLFGVYWLYVLLNDPNEHFKYHIGIEKQLLNALETVAT